VWMSNKKTNFHRFSAILIEKQFTGAGSSASRRLAG